jgi:hypothetical protein
MEAHDKTTNAIFFASRHLKTDKSALPIAITPTKGSDNTMLMTIV